MYNMKEENPEEYAKLVAECMALLEERTLTIRYWDEKRRKTMERKEVHLLLKREENK